MLHYQVIFLDQVFFHRLQQLQRMLFQVYFQALAVRLHMRRFDQVPFNVLDRMVLFQVQLSWVPNFLVNLTLRSLLANDQLHIWLSELLNNNAQVAFLLVKLQVNSSSQQVLFSASAVVVPARQHRVRGGGSALASHRDCVGPPRRPGT